MPSPLSPLPTPASAPETTSQPHLDHLHPESSGAALRTTVATAHATTGLPTVLLAGPARRDAAAAVWASAGLRLEWVGDLASLLAACRRLQPRAVVLSAEVPATVRGALVAGLRAGPIRPLVAQQLERVDGAGLLAALRDGADDLFVGSLEDRAALDRWCPGLATPAGQGPAGALARFVTLHQLELVLEAGDGLPAQALFGGLPATLTPSAALGERLLRVDARLRGPTDSERAAAIAFASAPAVEELVVEEEAVIGTLVGELLDPGPEDEATAANGQDDDFNLSDFGESGPVVMPAAVLRPVPSLKPTWSGGGWGGAGPEYDLVEMRASLFGAPGSHLVGGSGRDER